MCETQKKRATLDVRSPVWLSLIACVGYRSFDVTPQRRAFSHRRQSFVSFTLRSRRSCVESESSVLSHVIHGGNHERKTPPSGANQIPLRSSLIINPRLSLKKTQKWTNPDGVKSRRAFLRAWRFINLCSVNAAKFSQFQPIRQEIASRLPSEHNSSKMSSVWGVNVAKGVFSKVKRV